MQVDSLPSGGSDSKESACSVGDLGSIPGLGRSPGGRHGNPLQYSCLENPHGQRSLAGYYGVTKSRTQLSNFHSLTQMLLKSWWLSGKEPACQCRRCKRCRFNPWVGRTPWRRAWQPTPVSLPGESRGQRSLVCYSPWGRTESDTTEVT